MAVVFIHERQDCAEFNLRGISAVMGIPFSDFMRADVHSLVGTERKEVNLDIVSLWNDLAFRPLSIITLGHALYQQLRLGKWMRWETWVTLEEMRAAAIPLPYASHATDERVLRSFLLQLAEQENLHGVHST